MKPCCIIIPIYKPQLSKTELVSLKQCCKILGAYPIIFITHKKLDCSGYNEICSEYGVCVLWEYFPQIYFTNTHGYNALMLSKQYYERFAGYEYMLIYQLDAYVFSDQLVQWCDQRYDYIGAPWLDAQDTGENPAFQQPFSVGNGGFSLRRVQTFQSYCDYRIHLIFLAHFLSSIFDIIVKKTKQNPFYVLLRLCTWLPVKTFSKLFFPSEADKNNEDVIWAKRLAVVGIIPANNIAAQFSFEDYPEYMFQLHNGLLPFGCHHWNIYYHYQFWKSFIPLC